MTKGKVKVTFDMLKARFDKPLCDVATELGVCMTFIKKACRKNGIKRWPFRKVQAMRNRQERERVQDRPMSMFGSGSGSMVVDTIPLNSAQFGGTNPFLASVPVVQVRVPNPGCPMTPAIVMLPQQLPAGPAPHSESQSSVSSAATVVSGSGSGCGLLDCCEESPRLDPRNHSVSYATVEMPSLRTSCDSFDSTMLAAQQQAIKNNKSISDAISADSRYSSRGPSRSSSFSGEASAAAPAMMFKAMDVVASAPEGSFLEGLLDIDLDCAMLGNSLTIEDGLGLLDCTWEFAPETVPAQCHSYAEVEV